MYLISREGRGTARALTAALTVAILTAAERHAATFPQGRLATPLVCVLDEAANVSRIPDLPDLYSPLRLPRHRHRQLPAVLGPRGGGLGLEGMDKLWSAANIRLVGAGSAETEFLERVSKLIGDRDVVSRSSSSSRGRRTVSAQLRWEQLRWERILDVADLAALPAGGRRCLPPASCGASKQARPTAEAPCAPPRNRRRGRKSAAR